MRRRTVLIAGTSVLALLAVGTSWWYFDWGHADVERLPDLRGKPLDAVITSFGEPDQQFEYTMADSPGGEFRVELHNTYPPDDAEAAQAKIRELQWHRVRYHVAVWMHQVHGEWVVLNTWRWKAGVDF
jgi:hypothetical protein